MFAFNTTAVLKVQCVRFSGIQLCSPRLSLPAAPSQQNQCFCKPHMFQISPLYTSLGLIFNFMFNWPQKAWKLLLPWHVFIVQVKSNKKTTNLISLMCRKVSPRCPPIPAPTNGTPVIKSCCYQSIDWWVVGRKMCF